MTDDRKSRVAYSVPWGWGRELRASWDEWRGQQMAVLRVWYRDDATGEWRPDKQGINVSAERFPMVQEAVTALAEAMPEA